MLPDRCDSQSDPDMFRPGSVRPYRTSLQDWTGAGLPDTMIDRNLENSPVTTSDGKLAGLVRKRDVGLR
ncbi:MAG: hypothetical protein ACRDOH_00570 [Streptosporangiaceae bacterium]